MALNYSEAPRIRVGNPNACREYSGSELAVLEEILGLPAKDVGVVVHKALRVYCQLQLSKRSDIPYPGTVFEFMEQSPAHMVERLIGALSSSPSPLPDVGPETVSGNDSAAVEAAPSQLPEAKKVKPNRAVTDPAVSASDARHQEPSGASVVDDVTGAAYEEVEEVAGGEEDSEHRTWVRNRVQQFIGGS